MGQYPSSVVDSLLIAGSSPAAIFRAETVKSRQVECPFQPIDPDNETDSVEGNQCLPMSETFTDANEDERKQRARKKSRKRRKKKSLEPLKPSSESELTEMTEIVVENDEDGDDLLDNTPPETDADHVRVLFLFKLVAYASCPSLFVYCICAAEIRTPQVTQFRRYPD